MDTPLCVNCSSLDMDVLLSLRLLHKDRRDLQRTRKTIQPYSTRMIMIISSLMAGPRHLYVSEVKRKQSSQFSLLISISISLKNIIIFQKMLVNSFSFLSSLNKASLRDL